MPELFEDTAINGLELKNRFIRSATWEGLAGKDGSVTKRLTDRMVQLARGGVGLIITGHSYVTKDGQALSWQLGAHEDSLVPGLAGMVKAVHEQGGKIAIQLAHAGSWAASHLTGLEQIGPSVPDTERGLLGRQMTEKDIRCVIEAFAAAAERARIAGFDAIQLHGAHGYLINQFLSLYFNKRDDDYGGSIENRSRFAAEVIKAIRVRAGSDVPLFIKLNSEDFLPGGLMVNDAVRISVILEQAGIDCIEMSGGTFLSGDKAPSRKGKTKAGEPEAYYEAAARTYKQLMGIPLILVGGIRSLETAEKLVKENVTDYISLCRPLICEPGLVNRWKSGDRRPAMCISDNGCFKPGFEGKGVFCLMDCRKRDNAGEGCNTLK